MYERVGDFVDSGGAIYSTPGANFPGRKRHKAAAEVAEHWEKATQPVSRLNGKGESLRVALGGRGKLAAEIAAQHSCSKATVYRYFPGTVVPTKKASDLCHFRESLRKTRLDCVRLANEHGANVAEPDQLSGQRDVACKAKAAETYLANLPSEPKVTRKVVSSP